MNINSRYESGPGNKVHSSAEIILPQFEKFMEALNKQPVQKERDADGTSSIGDLEWQRMKEFLMPLKSNQRPKVDDIQKEEAYKVCVELKVTVFDEQDSEPLLSAKGNEI